MLFELIASMSALTSQQIENEPSWNDLQATITEVNSDWQFEFLTEGEFYLDRWVATIEVAKIDTGCQLRIIANTVYDSPYTTSDVPFLTTRYVLQIPVGSDDTLILSHVPFQPHGEEPLPYDFPQNLAFLVKDLSGDYREITHVVTKLNGREILGDPWKKVINFYPPRITSDFQGNIDTDQFVDLFKAIGQNCGVKVEEVLLRDL